MKKLEFKPTPKDVTPTGFRWIGPNFTFIYDNNKLNNMQQIPKIDPIFVSFNFN